MATSYTSLLGLALPVTGELAGTWGDTVNNSITSLLDTAVAGTTTLSTDADVTLTTTTGASNQARQAILLCSGARTALRTITAPAQSKIYVVINNTTGGFGVKLVGAGPTTGITVAAGKTAVLVWNGSDFVEVAPATATTATNLAGGAAGSVPYQTGAGATTFLSIGTNNFVLTSNGAAPVWTTNTGTGNVVRATSPTLTTPTLGVATATSINKVAITAPATGSTLAIADGKTLTASNTLTLTGTDGSSVAFGTGGTVTYTSNNLSVFAATTSAQLAGVISDETGSGPLVFGTSPTIATPTITTSATVPLLIGGTGTTSTLTLRSTSGVGATGADIIFQTGNNGATEAMRILNSGNVGIGTASPVARLDIQGTGAVAAVLNQRTDTTSLSTPLMFKTAGFNYWAMRQASGALTWYQDTAVGGTTTEYMRISSTGDVGIGTTSTPQKLTIAAGNVQVDNSYYIQGKIAAGAATRMLGINASNLCYVGSVDAAVAGIYFNNNGTNQMIIDSSGRLGLGVSPTVLFHISSGDATALIENTAASSNATIQLKYPSRTWSLANRGADLSGSFAIRDATAAADRLIITSAGNVGIGTNAPGAKLDVNGSLKTGYIGATSALATQLSASGAGYLSYASGATYLSSFADNLGNAAVLAFMTGNSERIRIDTNGNVGIGTTSPVNKLQINGSLGRNAPVTKTGNFTLADTENWLICNGTGTITVTLPAASSWTGREVMIKTIAAFTVVSASSNVVPLAGGAAGTAILAATAGQFATLVSDGTNWIIMQAN